MHFSKVKDSIAHEDKIHTHLNDDNMRDKTIQGALNKQDCDDENACEFMCLLKRRTKTQIDELKEMNEIEFRKVVQQAKKRSTLWMFSKRDYSVCKCAMKSDRMVKVLVKFHDVIIK